eukprot:2924295-Amphidinium_carterae.1
MPVESRPLQWHMFQRHSIVLLAQNMVKQLGVQAMRLQANKVAGLPGKEQPHGVELHVSKLMKKGEE